MRNHLTSDEVTERLSKWTDEEAPDEEVRNAFAFNFSCIFPFRIHIDRKCIMVYYAKGNYCFSCG